VRGGRLAEGRANCVLSGAYLRIDPARVAEHLAKAPAQFSEFARQIRNWLAQAVGAP
jgi:uncharacterized protein YutE (UPF0331/DUF86 family)